MNERYTRCLGAVKRLCGVEVLRVWFERGLPPDVASMLVGSAEPIGPRPGSGPLSDDGIAYAHAVIASSLLTYDGALMDRATELLVIARTGIGYDKIDVAAATARGIAVCNAPDAPTRSTAEHAIALLLAVAKQVPQAQASLRRGDRGCFAAHNGIEIAGRTIGVVGLGRIGATVARLAAAIGMEVVGFDPYAETVPEGISRIDTLDHLLRHADVVSLHLPLTGSTAGLLDAAAFRRMKRGAILINTARGGLVDQNALLAAISDGKLFGAGLDVTTPDPLPADHPLLAAENVIVTPHVAAATGAGKARLYSSAVSQALQVLGGERPPHLVNPEVWPVRRPDLSEKQRGDV
jgi:phosphoglycerate dehydrogenase-like enzyme